MIRSPFHRGGRSIQNVLRSKATPAARLAYSTGCLGRPQKVVHVLSDFHLIWSDGVPVANEGWFTCAANQWPMTGSGVELLDSMPDDEAFTPCRICDVFDVQVAPHVVYLATNGEELKVGHTEFVTRRMVTLRTDLLLQIPGDRDTERRVLDRIGRSVRPARGREWFDYSISTHRTICDALLTEARQLTSQAA